MSDPDKINIKSEAADGEFDKLMREFRGILIDGIKHGFFDGEITVRSPRSDRRDVLISVGKSYKYTIKIDDLPH